MASLLLSKAFWIWLIIGLIFLLRISLLTCKAFDEVNQNTEFLLRTLLLQHRINFNEESKQYQNPNWDKEFEINGIKFEKEKIYLINEDRVDEYTKQLEYQLKEKDKKITELENMLKSVNKLEDNMEKFI